jgi:hypothetical protein
MKRKGKPEGAVAKRSDYEFGVCKTGIARKLVSAHHYSKSASFMGTAFCLWPRGGDPGEPIAAAITLPPLPPVAKKYASTSPGRVTSLSRVVVVPGQPKNVASMLVSRALRQTRKDKRYDTVVTYADTAEGHTGAIYRATNAEYLGLTKPKAYWIDPATGRRVAAKATRTRTVAQMRALGYERRVSPGKHVFRWRLDD